MANIGPKVRFLNFTSELTFDWLVYQWITSISLRFVHYTPKVEFKTIIVRVGKRVTAVYLQVTAKIFGHPHHSTSICLCFHIVTLCSTVLKGLT